jgi:Ig-like domain CHU_C associated
MVSSCPGGGLPIWYVINITDGERTNLATANNYSPIVASSVIYNVSCANDLCTISGPLTVTINPIPATPIVADVTIHTGVAASLTATGCAGGLVNWYASATSIPFTSTGATYITSPLSANTNYYFECNLAACVSPRGSNLVTVSACPANIDLLSPLNTFTSIVLGLETSGEIKAQNIISGGNIKYDAAHSITLSPGFKVDSGTIFRAIIDGCSGAY